MKWSAAAQAASAVVATVLTIALLIYTRRGWKVATLAANASVDAAKAAADNSAAAAANAAAAAKSADISTAMLVTTQRIERAFVTMSHKPPGIEVGHYISSSTDNPVPHRDASVTVVVKNHGNTPAIVTATLLQLIITNQPLPPSPQYDFDKVMQTGVLLVKGDQFDTFINFVIESEGIDRIRRDDVQLYILGYVDYLDQFGARHRAGYGRKYEPSLDSRSAYRDVRGQVDEEAFRTRNNLPYITHAGYNYDRPRVRGEGHDWDDPSLVMSAIP